MKNNWYLLLVIVLLPYLNSAAQNGMVAIKGGTFVPLFGTDSLPVTVKDFKMDIYPVSSTEYLKFVKEHGKWQKSRVLRLFADQNYLSTWLSDTVMGSNISEKSAITNVSWFAAKDYCSCQGKRLPTVDEWEFVAMSNQTLPDARKVEHYNEYILTWYEKPKTFNNPIGSTFKNYYGVYDMHGLVWEWTSDFNSVLISGESRKDKGEDNNLFCGGGSIDANDLMNYAAFMRYALRGSLKANFAMRNLGFRCVKDREKKN
jgi:formylglycine-generating enzyme required for sulfatase activity